ncbi:hypothetical protein [Brevibacterium samyangense]
MRRRDDGAGRGGRGAGHVAVVRLDLDDAGLETLPRTTYIDGVAGVVADGIAGRQVIRMGAGADVLEVVDAGVLDHPGLDTFVVNAEEFADGTPIAWVDDVQEHARELGVQWVAVGAGTGDNDFGDLADGIAALRSIHPEAEFGGASYLGRAGQLEVWVPTADDLETVSVDALGLRGLRYEEVSYPSKDRSIDSLADGDGYGAEKEYSLARELAEPGVTTVGVRSRFLSVVTDDPTIIDRIYETQTMWPRRDLDAVAIAHREHPEAISELTMDEWLEFEASLEVLWTVGATDLTVVRASASPMASGCRHTR